MKTWFGACAVVLVLSGCASAGSPYQPLKMNGGYKDVKVAEGRYSVTFIGNSATGQTMAEEMALMRGAELCQQAGYAHMRVFARSVDVDQAYGVNTITTTADVACDHEAGFDTRPVADIIAEVRADFPAAMPKP